MKTIIDPLNNLEYSIFSNESKNLLKQYVKSINNIGG